MLSHSMSVFIATLIACSLSPTLTFAATFKTEKSEVQFENVDLLSSAEMGLSETEHFTLSPFNHGLRKAALYGLVPVPIYVLQFLTSRPQKMSRSDDSIIKSLKEAGPIELYFTMLRNLPGLKMVELFKEGLVANHLGPRHLSTEIEQFLNEIQNMTELKKGSSFSVNAIWKDKQVTLFLQDPGGEIKSVTGPEEFADHFFSIWFGKPSDPKVKELKKDLLR